MIASKKLFVRSGLLATIFMLFIVLTSCHYDQVLPEIYSEDDVTLSGDLIPIFEASCNSASCHNTGGIPPDLTAANAYQAMFDGNYINVNMPEESEMYKWVNGERSPTMPLTGTDPLIASAVLLWIQQGAQDN